MHNLLDFLRKNNYWFLFILLEIVCMALLFGFNNYQGSSWFTAANNVTAKVDEWYANVITYVHLKDVNKDLTERNIVLQRQVAELRNALEETEKDSTTNDQLLANALKGFTLINASVVSNSINKANNYIVIDKGSKDGIHQEMGIVGGGGIVGIVSLVSDNYSLVVPCINVSSNISCRVRGHRFFGSLQWEGENPFYGVVNDIPRYANIKKGDYIETSGYSSVFPPGLFIGKVSRVENSNDGLSYKLTVNLGTNFSNLRNVVVVANESRPMIDSLRVHALEAERPTE